MRQWLAASIALRAFGLPPKVQAVAERRRRECSANKRELRWFVPIEARAQSARWAALTARRSARFLLRQATQPAPAWARSTKPLGQGHEVPSATSQSTRAVKCPPPAVQRRRQGRLAADPCHWSRAAG